MEKQSVLFVIIGLLVGIILTGFTASYAVNHNSTSMMGTFGMHGHSSNSYLSNGNDMMDHPAGNGDMSMNNMVSELKGRTGDDFDKAFLSEMIDHHQGALDMATFAKSQAKHDEIKALAGTIIAAQTTEITQMKAWQKQWGY